MEISFLAAEVIQIIEKLRTNIDSIHKAKHSRWSKDLNNLLFQNKALLMQLRKGQRDLTENAEKSKEDLLKTIEKTDDLHSKYEQLKYEKASISNEISRIKKLDTQELEYLGIPVTGEKTFILEKFDDEMRARKDLKEELENKERTLQEARTNLTCVEERLRCILEGLKRVDSVSDTLNSLLPCIDIN